MCDYCEAMEEMLPRCADLPSMDVCAMVEGWVTDDGERHGVDLVIYNQMTTDEAYFSINFCPMCGRRLKGNE